MLRVIQNSVLSLVYPQECSVCHGDVEDIKDGGSCRKCWSATRIFTGDEMLCNKCGALLGEQAAIVPVSCLQCDKYSFEKAYAVGVYEKALAASVVQLKTSPHLSHRVRRLIQTTINTKLSVLNIDLIIPIPLSKVRRIERGFNQAEIISAEVGRALRTTVDNLSLVRNRHTPIHRVGMDHKARELTVAKAFEVVRPNLLKEKSILLIDDVLTSGATSSACANILRKSGSGSVFVFTLARAVLH